MTKVRGRRWWVRFVVVCGLVGSALIPPGMAVSPAAAADPRLPNHLAEQQYFDSIRQTPQGVSRGQARFAALENAKALPQAKTVPAALGGKGVAVGKDGLGPPSAVWQQLGPAPEDADTVNHGQDFFGFGHVSGRATAIVIGQHTGVIYLGTADGGVWKSVNDGASWTPLTDHQPSLAVGSLALDPTDATDGTLYVGTGETNYDRLTGGHTKNGDAYFGVGILKTTDGGSTWALLGQSVFGGAYSATSVGIGAIALSGSAILAGTTSGLFRSPDGGATWAQITVAAGFPNARVTEILLDGATVYAVLSETDGGHTYSGVYKSTTGGTAGSFSRITTGLPAGTSWGRAQAAIAATTPQTLYLAIAKPNNSGGSDLLGIYKTTDGGAHWALTSGQPENYFNEGGGGQGFYDNFIAVDPSNANLVYAGGVNMVATTNGGASWAIIADVYCSCPTIHPDQHGGAFGPSGTPRPFYAANDGGAWKTLNGNAGTGTTWTDLNTNLATTQFYAGDAAANYATTPVVAGGSQDNGTSRSASASLGQWNAILGGDGGYVAVSKTDPKTIYAEYPSGSLQKTTNASAGSAVSWASIAPSCGAAQFVAPFVMDPNNASHLIFGGANLCETMNGGSTWGTSNTLTSFSSQFGVKSVAIAPTSSVVLYAVTDTGFAYKTANGNTGSAAPWSDCASASLPAHPSPATYIAVDGSDPNTAYVTFGGFGVGHIWKTTNCTTWTNITGNLPDIPVTSIATYPSTPNPTLVVGTDVGVFLSTNNGTSWSALTNGLPDVGIEQVFTDAAWTTLFVATHGRGMWKMPIPSDTLAAPTTTAISPNLGLTTGGTPVTITGTNFRAGAAVYFDGIAATSVVVVNATHITAVTPAHPPATVPVTVVDSDSQGGTLNQGYTYDTLHALPSPAPAGPTNSTVPNPQPLPQPSVPLPGNPNRLPPPRL
jgi:photosystem II stability/assembly factor-like uncharacterized protein